MNNFLIKRKFLIIVSIICAVSLFSCKDSSNPVSPPPPPPGMNGDSTNYYVDASLGSDSNKGTSSDEAWQTLNKVNNTSFKPGDKILFKSGQTFTGSLSINSSGTSEKPIIFDTYGGNDKATLDGEGKVDAVIYAKNKQYFELTNLDVTNYLPTNDLVTGIRFFGIHILNEDAGTLSHIYFENCKVHDINSEYDSFDSRYYGGVLIEVKGDSKPSNYDDLRVEGCTFENISRTGFNFKSSWKLRNSDTGFGSPLGDGRTANWYPSKNIIIRNNVFKKISGNGLIVRVADGALVEKNLFDENGKDISGNATFCFNTDNTLFQYNEAKNTIYNPGDTDARGIDSDYRTKGTIIQYNYLHDNGRGGVVATGGPEEGKAPERFNIGTIIRYNILEDNDQQEISFSGNLYDAYVYNNVVYNTEDNKSIAIVRFAKWRVWPHDVRFDNNIFYVMKRNAMYTFGSSKSIVFSHNVYFGPEATNLPITKTSQNINGVSKDSAYVLENPLFVTPGGGVSGYLLQPGSPAIGVGIVTDSEEQPSMDYFGNTINPPLNIGIFQGNAN